MNRIISIAIDGPAGAGKSTIAKALARDLDIMYLDTGAMYRALGLYMLRRGIRPGDAQAVLEHMDEADLSVEYLGGTQHTFLAGEDVSKAIREPEISMAASDVSAIAEVRVRMVDMQRRLAQGRSVVMDGRDIGTKVLPDATLKVYLTASFDVRVERRVRELERKGIPQSEADVRKDMEARDEQDMHRDASPLCAAADAQIVDTSDMDQEQVIARIRELLEQALRRGEESV